MPDVTIHHCTLRIVRRGGWSWGAAPEKLLQSAIKVLPELIARELGQFWSSEDDEEIAAPVRINIPIRLEELLAISDAGFRENEFSYSSEFTVVGQRINSAIRAALIDKCGLPEPALEVQTSSEVGEEVEELRSRPESFVVEVLRSWQREGVLAQRLSVFSAAALEAWHEYIVKTSDDATVFGSHEIDAIGPVIEESLRLMPLAAATRDAILRRRLIVIAEVIARLELARCPRAVLSKLDEMIPLARFEASDEVAGSVVQIDREAESSATREVSHSADLPVQDRVQLTVAESQSASRESASGVTEFQGQSSSLEPGSILDSKTARHRGDLALVQAESTSREIARSIGQLAKPVAPQQSHSNLQAVPIHQPLQRITKKLRREAGALPFLLLGPLSRIGYLKTLAAVLEASENTEASPLFATALAYKLLAPPERGWRRDAASLSTAAAFAGLESPAAEPALVRLAQTLSPHLSPLDATLSGALTAGHNPRAPLLLLSTREKESDRFVLFDSEGLFPIQWAASINDLRSTLIQLDSSIVFVPRASADVELLRWLTDQSLYFVTDAPPTRGETLRSIRRAELRWWTNDETTPDSVFAQMASSMPSSVDDALELLQVLAKDRPAITLARDSALDRHLTHAAAVALGTIAWDLWKEREQTAPHVALERFADLHTRVDYSDDLVTVNLPLGKRFLDLRDHRMLEDVHDVPWLNGRKLIFTSC